MKEKECWYPVSFETMVQVERKLDHHHLRKRNCLPTCGVGEGGGDESGDDNSTSESFLVTGVLKIRKYLHFSLLILYFLKYSPYDKMVLYR